jgi:hypothetical protein
MLQYAIAWPYRCACRLAMPRGGRGGGFLQIDIEGTGGQEGLKVRAWPPAGAVDPPDHQRPGPAGASVPEEPTLFADAPVVVARGGRGDYAWEKVVRKGSGEEYWTEIGSQNGDLMYGGSYQAPGRSEQQAMIHCLPSQKRDDGDAGRGLRVGGRGQGRPRAPGPASGRGRHLPQREFPITFWVVAPLPPDARPVSFTSFRRRRGSKSPGPPHSPGYVKCKPLSRARVCRNAGLGPTVAFRGHTDRVEEPWTP